MPALPCPPFIFFSEVTSQPLISCLGVSLQQDGARCWWIGRSGSGLSALGCILQPLFQHRADVAACFAPAPELPYWGLPRLLLQWNTSREGGGNNMQLLILWCSVWHGSILSVMTLVVSPCPSSPGGCGSSACAWSSKLVFHFALLQVCGICIMMAPAVLCQLKVVNMLVTDKQPHIARR